MPQLIIQTILFEAKTDAEAWRCVVRGLYGVAVWLQWKETILYEVIGAITQ